MKLYEFWQAEYRKARHLEYFSDEEVKQRAKDIFCNYTTLTEEEKIGLLPGDEAGQRWMRLWTDVLEEFVLRFGPYPGGFKNGSMKDAIIPKWNWPHTKKGIEKIKELDLQPGSFMIKFGEKKYLKNTFSSGKVRIAPASLYKDPSLNPAIRDSEMEIALHAHPSEIKLEAVDGRTGQPKGNIKPTGNITFILESPTDYYVYCLSSSFNPHLFGDFEADCCIVITQPQQFIERIMIAVKRIFPSWRGFGTNALYLDPMLATDKDLSVFFAKHFRYTYQNEYRLIWLPNKPTKSIKPIIIELGSLDEIAIYIEC